MQKYSFIEWHKKKWLTWIERYLYIDTTGKIPIHTNSSFKKWTILPHFCRHIWPLHWLQEAFCASKRYHCRDADHKERCLSRLILMSCLKLELRGKKTGVRYPPLPSTQYIDILKSKKVLFKFKFKTSDLQIFLLPIFFPVSS